MVVVKEDEGLLTEHNEDGIAELEELGDIEKEDPASSVVGVATGIANHFQKGLRHQISPHRWPSIVVESHNGQTQSTPHSRARAPNEDRMPRGSSSHAGRQFRTKSLIVSATNSKSAS